MRSSSSSSLLVPANASHSAQVELTFSMLPPIMVLPTHMSEEKTQQLEDQLLAHDAALTFDATEARLFVGDVATKRRAAFELRSRGLWTEEYQTERLQREPIDKGRAPDKARADRTRPHEAILSKKTGGSSTEDLSATEESVPASKASSTGAESEAEDPGSDVRLSKKPADDFLTDKAIRVVTSRWLEESLAGCRVLPFEDFTVYKGKITTLEKKSELSDEEINNQVSKITDDASSPADPKFFKEPLDKSGPMTPPPSDQKIPTSGKGILDRAQADGGNIAGKFNRFQRSGAASSPSKFSRRRKAADTAGEHLSRVKAPKLIQTNSSEFEALESDLPPLPDWAKGKFKYSCQRSTPADPPNDSFIQELKRIRLIRTLTLDEIGVRAYSTSIAAIAAYPHVIHSPKEILRLPGCDIKIANLWIEWRNTGHIEAAEQDEKDDALRVIRLFYDIWGVGATTAREFYFDRGWRDLDDVIEYGWSTLHRVQQIGVKYYDEFLIPIPRQEVESIAATVTSHAKSVRSEDPGGIEVAIVGGYRRGKVTTSDVDLIVSHRDIAATYNLATDIVATLEESGFITHTLLLSENNSQRGQSTLPFRTDRSRKHTGFDTLDKALVVWQDPQVRQQSDQDNHQDGPTPNPHRRVDIIISPWRTVGCAVLGWSGGTTFQRDLRRYAKNFKGWKFDSSGVRDRLSGRVVPLEKSQGPATTGEGWQEAEKRVFEGFGLDYVEPWERCTG